MDNLSHSLVGLAAGEFVHRSLKAEPDPGSQSLRRRLLLVSGWAACNFPDLDLFLTPLLPNPLGYLLHHRGHTHTLLYALPQALLLLALMWMLWPAARTLLRHSASARRGLLASVGLGLLLHLGMDFLNSYGIHPFHPFDSRWLYGDLVFILEPVFWVAFGVPLAMMLARPALRTVPLALLGGALLVFAFKGFLPWGSLLALAGVAGLLGTLQHLGRGSRRALAGALVASLAFIGLQAAGSASGKRLIAATLQQGDPSARVLDIAMSAYPANPVCWSFASVESNEGAGTYTLRRGTFSLAPRLLPVSACPAAMAENPAPRQVSAALAFFTPEQGSLAALRALDRGNCHFAAWLRFARMPSVSAAEASDARFRLSPKGNFSTMRFAEANAHACPGLVPQWDKPRADLLTPR